MCAWWNTDKQFSSLQGFRPWNFHLIQNLPNLEMTPTPTYLSRIFGDVKVIAMSVYMFKVLLLSIFYKKHTK
jgi:hypothetical protein